MKILSIKLIEKIEPLGINKLKGFVLCFAFIMFGMPLFSQRVTVYEQNVALSDVLITLRDQYNVQVSFNHDLLKQCIVSDSAVYESPEEAIATLSRYCNLTYENNNGVFIVYQLLDAPNDTVISQKFHYSGQLLDGVSLEPLPFSSIQLNDYELMADASGNFAFSTHQNLKDCKVSHLGYFVLDTMLFPGKNQKVFLTPSVIGLDEVIVNSEAKIFTSNIGEQPGLIKVNEKVASFLPGNNNNTLFNLLRLQPGIVATYEQSGDYIIWGSYRGQTLLQFDGIPLFNAHSLNNEIGLVNPLIVKDVEVFKGGYAVDKGDRVGGIIEMTGLMGDVDKFTGNINVNSQTVSGKINLPINKQYAFQVAFRQSYYSIINWDDVWNLSDDNASSYIPEYQFQDMNLKLSGRFKNGDNFYVSMLGNNDNSAFNVNEQSKFRGRAWENIMDKRQMGSAVNYNKHWKSVGKTSLSAAYSNLFTSAFDQRNGNKNGGSNDRKNVSYYRVNNILEQSVKLHHQFPLIYSNQVKVGFEAIGNATNYVQDTVAIRDLGTSYSSNRINFFIKDNLAIGPNFQLQPGLKVDLFPSLNRTYLSPRIIGNIKPSEHWKINFAWGIYNQYITEMTLYDELGNSYYFWALSDATLFPVVESEHNVLGISYKRNGFKIGAEAFYKTMKGLSRFTNDSNRKGLIVTRGKGRVKGLDFYTKKTIGKHDIWLSYTLSKTEEMFDLYDGEFYTAPQNQTHELKLASILNFKPWFFSANYVYGSGLESLKYVRGDEDVPYHRLDIAFLYKFKTAKFNLSSGLSIVNVFNYNNIGLTYLSKLPDNKSTYAKGIPFTPSVFINIGF